jgi:hypothetical protein
MLRDQQFIGSSRTHHLDPHQHRRDYDCVKSVHADGFHGMQALYWPSIWLAKGQVSPNVPNRAARFDSAYHVAFCQVLMFQTYRRLDKDSSFFQHPQRLPRKPKSNLVK